MTDSVLAQPHDITGAVKWFDPSRGFGFIVDDAAGADVLLHANVLRNFGRSTVRDGMRVRCRVTETQRGRQAVEILELSAEHAAPAPVVAELSAMDASALAAMPLLPARVKWFDRGKGFGFANVFGQCGDVFLHAEVLRHAGLSELMPGEAVGVKVVDGRRGRMAAHVAAWDDALAGHPLAAVAARAAARWPLAAPTPASACTPWPVGATSLAAAPELALDPPC